MVDKTFMKITNKDIYDKLCDVEKRVQTTNGRVTLNRWIATTALTMIIAIGGLLGMHLTRAI